MLLVMTSPTIGNYFYFNIFNIYFELFYRFSGGVLTTGVQQWKAVHAMTIVGWGTQNNIPYWIIKNSWGPGWGEGGFLKLARNRDMRNVNEYLYYPLF